MAQFTAPVHTRITVTAPDAEAAERLIRDLTDRAAQHMEDSAPAGDVIVHRSIVTIDGLAPTDDAAVWGDMEPCAKCDESKPATAAELYGDSDGEQD